MKKRILTVKHADGRTEYICQKCGAVMVSRETVNPNFSRGEYSEAGEEILQCTNPDCMITTPFPKIRVRDFQRLPEVSF